LWGLAVGAAEVGGAKLGEGMMTYFANNPSTWKAVGLAGKAMSAVGNASKTGAAVKKAAVMGVNSNANPPKSDRAAMRSVYQGTSLPLGGK
jgi:hypothetical protein